MINWNRWKSRASQDSRFQEFTNARIGLTAIRTRWLCRGAMFVEILPSLSISCFRFYNQRFLCSYEMMMYPFDIQAGICNKYLSSFFSNPSSINGQHFNVNTYPALSNNPLHGCQVWSLHLHGQSGAWVRLCWSTFYLCLNLKLVDNWPYILFYAS